jgi:hypothetical protein
VDAWGADGADVGWTRGEGRRSGRDRKRREASGEWSCEIGFAEEGRDAI